ncbi:hypothetical protein DYB32_005337, partial [Aphanomyces invadans]
ERIYLRQKDSLHDQIAWDYGDVHYYEDANDGGPLTCQYVFVLDALNFCFWPTPEYVMEYEHLARGLKTAVLHDRSALDASRLANVTTETVASWFAPFHPPQLDERVWRLVSMAVRKVQELGAGLARFFDGLALNLVRASKFSAVECIRLVLAHFPGKPLRRGGAPMTWRWFVGFQDHAVYKGDQVFLYKRVQILVGDVWAAYGRHIVDMAVPSTHVVGGFYDIDRLTMFGTMLLRLLVCTQLCCGEFFMVGLVRL